MLYWFGFDESIDTDSRVLCLDDLRPDECALLACMGPPPPSARESYGTSGRGGSTAGAGSSGGVGVGQGSAGDEMMDREPRRWGESPPSTKGPLLLLVPTRQSTNQILDSMGLDEFDVGSGG